MDHSLHTELLAKELDFDLETLDAALGKLGLELAQLGQHQANYVSTQHDAFLRGVESAEKVLSRNDPHGSNAAFIDEAQILAPEASRILDFDETAVGKAVSEKLDPPV